MHIHTRTHVYVSIVSPFWKPVFFFLSQEAKACEPSKVLHVWSIYVESQRRESSGEPSACFGPSGRWEEQHVFRHLSSPIGAKLNSIYALVSFTNLGNIHLFFFNLSWMWVFYLAEQSLCPPRFQSIWG